MIKAIAIDDEPPALRIIEHFCKTNGAIELIKTFTNPQEALDFMTKKQIDLIFIDIQMPNFNGIELYKKLSVKPLAIFTTAFSEYAVDGFNVNAVDYLLKPYTQQRFSEAITKAILRMKLNVKEKRILTVHANYSKKTIEIDSVLFIESFDDYIIIHLSNKESLTIRMTLKKIIDFLPADEFIRVHRSYIVSLRQISEVRNKHILIGNRKIPISPTYEQLFFKRFES
ncbi:MAG: LytTR family DNA-binding domain-containing protein [Paludibacteraceae bacterium]